MALPMVGSGFFLGKWKFKWFSWKIEGLPWLTGPETPEPTDFGLQKPAKKGPGGQVRCVRRAYSVPIEVYINGAN